MRGQKYKILRQNYDFITQKNEILSKTFDLLIIRIMKF